MAQMSHPVLMEVINKNMKFLITHTLTTVTFNKFTEEFKNYGFTTVVRVCDAIYNTTLVKKEGIHVLDWPLTNGAPPSNQTAKDWLNLGKIIFVEESGCCTTAYCSTALERAPAFIALTLIESGMKYEDTVQFIRQKWHELLIESNLCIWRNIVLKCCCTSMTPTVLETIVAFSKAGVPDAIGLEMELETGPA